MNPSISTLFLMSLAVFAFTINAQIPRQIAYQGVLTDGKGNVRSDGTYAVSFSFYDVETGGTALWTEEDSVTTQQGMFGVALGEKKEIALPFDKQYWLGVTVGGSEMKPRVKLVAAAYALRAEVADTAEVARMISNNTLEGAFIVNGRIGIGKTSSSQIPLSSDAGSPVGLAKGTGYFQIGRDMENTNANVAYDYESIQSRLADGKTPRKLLLNPFGGTVGVGTSDPCQALGFDARGLFGISNSTASPSNWLTLWTLDNQYGPAIIYPSSKGLRFGSWSGSYGQDIGWSERMRIDANGAVGIGTTQPCPTLSFDSRGLFGISNAASSPGNWLTFWTLNDQSGPAIIYPASRGLLFGSWSGNYGQDVGWTERMRIDTNGNIGIGTPTPTEKLEVKGNLKADTIKGFGGDWLYPSITGLHALGLIQHHDGNNGINSNYYHQLVLGDNGTWNQNYNRLYLRRSDGTYTNEIRVAYADQAGSSSSDRRFKTSISPLTSSLDKLSQLQGVSYNWNRAAFPERNFSEGRQIGLIAQDVEPVIPEVVSTDKDGYKSLAYDKLVAVLVEAVKEQKNIAERQQQQIDSLRAMVDELKMW